MKIRLFVSFLVLIILLSGWSTVTDKDNEKPPKKVCIEEFENRRAKFNEKVLNDIIASFDLDLEGFKEISYEDLYKSMKIGEKNEDIQSLQHLFVGSSNGEMRLFLRGNKGYFLYKRTDDNNVLKEISRIYEGGIWLVMSEKEVEGKRIEWGKEFDWSKCKQS